jgi:hypothetical protein
MGETTEDTARLEFQYKTVLDLGKFMYDSYFKLAAMSFTLNGLLLTAVSFLLPHPERMYVLGIIAVGVIGIVYNLGALCTYTSLVTLTGNLARQFSRLDHRLKLQVSGCRTSRSDGLGYASVVLTVIFFGLWIAVWLLLVLLRLNLVNIPTPSGLV